MAFLNYVPAADRPAPSDEFHMEISPKSDTCALLAALSRSRERSGRPACLYIGEKK